MPDMTMCTGVGCPIKDTCYRYRAIPTPYWQSYSTFKHDKEAGCPAFMKLMSGDKLASTF